MKDRENPNLFRSYGVIYAVKLETMYDGAAHIRKPDAIVQSRIAQRSNGAINFIQKLSA